MAVEPQQGMSDSFFYTTYTFHSWHNTVSIDSLDAQQYECRRARECNKVTH